MQFKLVSEYQPTGDQPEAIEALVRGFQEGNQCQTLLGVTGSGKTFTMANIIEKLNKPTLVIAHNKTLAAQLYGEFKEFFLDNIKNSLFGCEDCLEFLDKLMELAQFFFDFISF